VKAKQVTIKENSWLAKLAAIKLGEKKMAMVLGRTIHLHNTTAQEFLQDEKWLKHELKHIEQYRRHGVVGFLSRYLLESVKKGYHHNKFEKEARACECEESLEENSIRFKIK
jgi:hypothetical protein